MYDVCCHMCELYKTYPEKFSGMIDCNTCGNKRCPKATEHSLKCTKSNDTGQPGSIYGSPTESFIEARDKAKERDRLKYESRSSFI